MTAVGTVGETADSRQIGPVLAMAIVAGNMIGSGVFLLPAVLAAVGSASLIAWAIAAVISVLLALVFALLGTIRPGSESLTDYPGTAFHPALGWLAWAAYWVSCFAGVVAVVIVAVGYGAAIFGIELSAAGRLAAILAAIWILSACALAGPRFVGRMSSATLAIGLAPIVMAVVLGAARFDADVFAASWNVTGEPLGQVLPPTLLGIFWAFLGLESANAISGSLREPKRNIAVAAAGGVALAALVYAAATAALFGLMPAAVLAASSAPFADVATQVVGPVAGLLIACAAFIRTMGCAASWVLVSAETAQSGARRGFLPRVLTGPGEGGRLVREVVFNGALMSAVGFLTLTPALVEQFNAISAISVYLFLLVYVLCSLALIRFAGGLADGRVRLAARGLGAVGAAASAWIAWAAFAG